MENLNGVLYIVSVPIGNLEDITLRALRILKEADIIAAEDTRHTRKLLSYYDIHTPIISYYEYNEVQRNTLLIRKLLNGEKVALVPDSGTPAISDPGYSIINECIKAGVQITPIPGPSALLAAIAISGFPLHNFIFEGFLPSKKSGRVKKLDVLKNEVRTIALFESPHRLLKSLIDMLEILGDRELLIANDITKVYEELYRGTISQAIQKYTESVPRGEFTIVIRGARPDEFQDN